MTCNTSYDDNVPCDMKNDDGSAMTAKDACNISRDKGSNWKDVAMKVLEVTNPISAAAGLVEAFKTKSKSSQDIINELDIDIDLDTIIEQTNECNNSIALSNVNSISCTETKACGDLQQLYAEMGAPPSEVIKFGCNISDVSQEIKVHAEQLCAVDSMIAALSDMEASIDNQTMMSVLNEAKGIMAGSESDQFVCNDISTTMSACKYINVSQCCDNQIKSSAINSLDLVACGEGAHGISQAHNINAKNTCLLSSDVKVEDSGSADTKNKSEMDAENYSEGITMGFLLVLLAVLFIIFIAVPAIGISTLKKYVWLLGILLIIIGALLVVRYKASPKRAEFSGETTGSSCLGSCAVMSDAFDVGENEIEDLVDASHDNGSQGFELNNGEVRFITKLDKKKNKNCKDKNVFKKLDKCDKNSDSYTYVRQKKRTLALYSAIACIVMGLILLLVGVVKMSKSSKITGMVQQPFTMPRQPVVMAPQSQQPQYVMAQPHQPVVMAPQPQYVMAQPQQPVQQYQ